MSKSSQSPIDCSSPSSPDITAIALKLQEAAQALLAIGAPGGSGRFSEPFFNACSIYENQSDDSLEDDEDDPEEDACCGGGKAKTSAQLRTYRVPGYVVDDEKRLLAEHEVMDWQALFVSAHGKLELIAQLMRHFEQEEEVDGFFLNRIAEDLLSPALDMLGSLCQLVADFRDPEEV